MSDIATVCVVVVAAIFYFLPAMVGYLSDKRNLRAIFALDLLAGWTIVGWIVALVWALTKDREEKP